MQRDAPLASEPIRATAVAGSWYPSEPQELAAVVDRYLDDADMEPRNGVRAIIAPHAGLVYSGSVAAHAYGAVRNRSYEVAVLIGPSHFVGFDGVSIYQRGAFDTPLGPAPIDTEIAERILARSSLIVPYAAAHRREHSLELQLPFLKRVLPETPIVPLVIGYQVRKTIMVLAEVLAEVLSGKQALLVASTDLSHYFDARRAAELDGRVIEHVGRFDGDGLLSEFERYPENERGRYVACGGGAAIAAMWTARALGAIRATVLKRSDSGEVSGDTKRVVGYLAAIME